MVDANDPTVWQYNKAQWENTGIGDAIRGKATDIIKGLGMGCYGEGCCSENTVYNKEIGKCIIPGEDGTEGFQQRTLNYVMTEPIVCPGQNYTNPVSAFNKAESFSHVK